MTDTQIGRWLGRVSLWAVVAWLAAAEYRLGLAADAGPYVSVALPVALDAYLLAVVRAWRPADLALALVCGVASQAASHLVAAGVLHPGPLVAVTVSVLPVIAVWRVHALARHSQTPEPPAATELDVPDFIRDAGPASYRLAVRMPQQQIVDAEIVAPGQVAQAPIHPAIEATPQAPVQASTEAPIGAPTRAPIRAAGSAPDRAPIRARITPPIQAPMSARQRHTNKRPTSARLRGANKGANRASSDDIIRALMDDLGRRPKTAEMVAALKAAGRPITPTGARTARARVEKQQEQQ